MIPRAYEKIPVIFRLLEVGICGTQQTSCCHTALSRASSSYRCFQAFGKGRDLSDQLSDVKRCLAEDLLVCGQLAVSSFLVLSRSAFTRS